MGRHILVRHSLDTQTRLERIRVGRRQRLAERRFAPFVELEQVPLVAPLVRVPPVVAVVFVHRLLIVRRLGARLSYGTSRRVLLE